MSRWPTVAQIQRNGIAGREEKRPSGQSGSKRKAEHIQPTRWKFIAMAQGQVRQREFTEPYVLISVQDTGESPLTFDESPLRVAVLALQFDDIERPERGKVLFTSDDALDILDFVAEHKGNVTTIACHCKVGMSRSPAVIAALAELLGCGDILADPRGKRKYRPNRHVYETLLQAGRRHKICDLE